MSQTPARKPLYKSLYVQVLFAVIVGVLAATGTPQAAIDRIASEMEAVARMPDTVQVLANAGVDSLRR